MTGRIHILLAAVLIAVSCTVEPMPETTDMIPLELCTSSADPVKGLAMLDKEAIKSQRFGLFAYTETGMSWLRNNEMVFSRSENGLDYWESEEAAYWPLGARLDIFAYAPYQDGLTVTSYENGIPVLTVTPSSDVREQVDFCIAAPQFGKAARDAVHVAFEHTLTRVRFYINVSEGTPSGKRYKLSELTLSGVAASNTIKYSAAAGQTFTWSEIAQTDPLEGAYTLTDDMLTDDYLILENSLTDEEGFDRYTYVNNPVEGGLYLLPQSMTVAAKVGLSVDVYTEIEDTWQKEATLSPIQISLPEGSEWKAGGTVSYTFTVTIP